MSRGHIFAFTCVRDALEKIRAGKFGSDKDQFHARAAHHHLMQIASPTNHDACKGSWLGGDVDEIPRLRERVKELEGALKIYDRYVYQSLKNGDHGTMLLAAHAEVQDALEGKPNG